MAYRFTVADVAFLRSQAGAEALSVASERPLTERTMIADTAFIRSQFGDHAPSVLETARLRRKASAKIRDSTSWLFTDDALQQATASVVAEHRAQRLAGRIVHDVTCSVGADLAAVAAVADLALGSDVDSVRLAMASTNVPTATFVRADALQPCSRNSVIVADPARRQGGKRTYDPAQLIPPLPDLVEVYSGRPLVIKCAPGIDYAALDWSGEVEVTSLDGGVREACLWSSSLATPGVTRRATILRSHGETVTVTDDQDDDVAAGEPDTWIVDPDGAIVRAGLVRHYAAMHGLWQLDPHIAYLTGPVVPTGARGHRVLERLRFSEKELRRALARHDCGSLEILTRGVRVDPDALRMRMKLKGNKSLSAIVVRIGETPEVFVCEPTVGGARHHG
ncbi:class I SAM-dependent methyltransferase [Hoyosella rhizosphaerae]|uniref:THUMP-like domain-containing protein n=1 Tax=Hoyosella rhizosphaerae TaxID=1755582 RepID=A0A916X7M0_9ACTN|nr:class I SAM-dependent methyltransferase [Hoyosella rhizosphaerae]MBN4927369.1 class I SAM-dependent methyltransferase [Hoyosella rhizosphaerae]GGC51803.1 hypothetical protein GCM10011410_00140 [Hoyosella rhizosphaerae]